MRWFLFAMVLANVASNMYVMLMPVFLKELGATVTQVGMVFTLSSLVPLALQIFGGWISDSIGRLRAIAIGSIGGVVGQFLMVVSPTWQWMLLAISIANIARSFVAPSFGAFIAEQSTEETRGRVYGISETIFQVVSVVGPPVGLHGLPLWIPGIVTNFIYPLHDRSNPADLDGKNNPFYTRNQDKEIKFAFLPCPDGSDDWVADIRRFGYLDLYYRRCRRYCLANVRSALPALLE
jgi:MFS family permease